MIKSFSGQVVFCFAILRAISAYVGENCLSQYNALSKMLLIKHCASHILPYKTCHTPVESAWHFIHPILLLSIGRMNVKLFVPKQAGIQR